MILCALKEASDKVTATNLSKQTELKSLTYIENAPDTGRKRTNRPITRQVKTGDRCISI